MRFFLETKQQSQATTIENLKSETGWEFTVLLIKKISVGHRWPTAGPKNIFGDMGL